MVNARAVPVSGRPRSNITIAEADGTVTNLNEPGSGLSAEELDALVKAIASTVESGDWVVISGSMPPEFTIEQVRDLVARIAEHDV